MAEDLTTTQKHVLAQVLVCGDVHTTTLYDSSLMLSATQQKALDELDEKGFFEHTLYEHHSRNYE